MAFHCLQAEVAKNEEALRVATVEISTLQVLLNIERHSCTSSPSVERELVHLQHSYSRLNEIARDLGFDAAGLLHTHSSNDPILLTEFGALFKAVLDRLGHV